MKSYKLPYIKRTYRISKDHAKKVKQWARMEKKSESQIIRELISSLK